jgi:hypothetical protein
MQPGYLLHYVVGVFQYDEATAIDVVKAIVAEAGEPPDRVFGRVPYDERRVLAALEPFDEEFYPEQRFSCRLAVDKV